MSNKIKFDVLEKSLTLESELSKIIIAIIKVPKSDLKTLGNKSSSLSFKTKVDLLYDLDRISLEEYKLLILFMEIRNQFIHNIDVKSFTDLVSVLDSDRKNKLLNVNPEVAETYKKFEKKTDSQKEMEDMLNIAFVFLHAKLREIIVKQYSDLLEDLKKEKANETHKELYEMALDFVKITQETVDEFADIWSEKIAENKESKYSFNKLMKDYINQKTIAKFQKKYPDLPK